jgi:hypothetical protein
MEPKYSKRKKLTLRFTKYFLAFLRYDATLSREDSTSTLGGARASNSTQLNGHGPKKKLSKSMSLNNGGPSGTPVDNLWKGKPPSLSHLENHPHSRSLFVNGNRNSTSRSMDEDDEEESHHHHHTASSSTSMPLPLLRNSSVGHPRSYSQSSMKLL